MFEIFLDMEIVNVTLTRTNKKKLTHGFASHVSFIGRQKMNLMLVCIVAPILPSFKRKEKNMLDGKNVAAEGEYVKYVESFRDLPRYDDKVSDQIDAFAKSCKKRGLAVMDREDIYSVGMDMAVEFERNGFEAGVKWTGQAQNAEDKNGLTPKEAPKANENKEWKFDESKCTMIETIMNRMCEMTFRLDLLADKGYGRKKALNLIYRRMKREYGIPLDFIVQKADNGGELPYFSTFEAVAIEEQLYQAFILIGNDMCGIKA